MGDIETVETVDNKPSEDVHVLMMLITFCPQVCLSADPFSDILLTCSLLSHHLQLRSGRQLLPILEDGEEGPVHPHLWGERRREDRGVQEDSAILCRHLSC